jgi:hypothetical protein
LLILEGRGVDLVFDSCNGTNQKIVGVNFSRKEELISRGLYYRHYGQEEF